LKNRKLNREEKKLELIFEIALRTMNGFVIVFFMVFLQQRTVAVPASLSCFQSVMDDY